MVGTLARRPVGGGSWSRLSRVNIALLGLEDPVNLISAQDHVAVVLDGSHLVITGNGGITTVRRATPCSTPGSALAVSAAVTSARGLALLCLGQGFSGHTTKLVYVSSDEGRHWHKAGMPPDDGVGGVIAGPTPAQLTVTADSFASWLYHSANAGRTWRIARVELDAGLGWADLDFTTATDGVVVRAPAVADGNPDRRPGQLMLTSNAGATWHLVRF